MWPVYVWMRINFMKKKWMEELSKEKNNREFSQLVHNYWKLATMRIMQEIRDKYQVPPEDIPTLMMSIFSRMLNEGCYAVGSNIRESYPITDFYSQEHLLNLFKVLNGERLDGELRKDLYSDIKVGLEKFKEFILLKGKDL